MIQAMEATGVQYRKDVGIRLARMREAIGIKPSQLSKELGVSKNRYSQWESGDNLPDVTIMTAFAERYGVTLDYIYRGDPSGLPLRLAPAS